MFYSLRAIAATFRKSLGISSSFIFSCVEIYMIFVFDWIYKDLLLDKKQFQCPLEKCAIFYMYSFQLVYRTGVLD